MADAFPLARYLARIGVTETPVADLATLAGLHAAHVASIAFEGMDPLLGRPVRLDPASIQEKLLDRRRGGYCFEQNALFRAALETIGFSVTGLGARVRWMSPPEAPLGPRTHMLLKVDLPDGAWIADVGFGAFLLDAPLRLQTDLEQRTAMGIFRLTEAAGLFTLSARQPDGWRAMYVFDMQPQLPADYELGSWYAATNPAAPFPNMLIIERVGAGRRNKLINRRLIIEERDGRLVSEQTIDDAATLLRVLDEAFGITPPGPAEELFARLGD